MDNNGIQGPSAAALALAGVIVCGVFVGGVPSGVSVGLGLRVGTARR